MELGILNELMTVVNATKSVRDILDHALGIILKALGESVGGACLTGDDSGQLGLVAHRGLAPELLPPLQHLAAEDELRQMCRMGTGVWVLGENGFTEEPLCMALHAAGCRSVLALPLTAREENQGFLFVGSSTLISIQPEDREFLNTVGRALGLEVANSRLYEQMAQRLRASEALYNISRAFVSTFDLDHLLGLIVHAAVDTISKANNCVLHLLDEKTGELEPMFLSFLGKPASTSGRSRMRSGRGVAGVALEKGQVVNVPDVASDPRFVRSGNQRTFASMLVAPLRLGERRIGTLSIDSQEAHAFSANDERLLMTLATQAAAAIENARLVSDLQQSLQNLKNTQAQLIQSEKLSAIGQLIAGVAHELNNPLTAIMGYTQLLQTSEEIDELTQRDLEKIYAQAQRAARIVQNLLTFARQRKAERQFVDVNEVIERTLELRAYQLRVENIQVTTQLADQVLGAMADPNQLQQVFLNLINNAQDAMTEYRGGGKLIVASEAQDGHVQVKFIDNGPGLLPEAKQHLFEPFFTTKEVGKGTGLGLSICFGIISEHGGRVWADSEPGKGATFVVELPYAEPHNDTWREDKGAPVSLAKSKLVLIVEDEEDVAYFIKRALVQDGHRVLVASNGETALDHLAKARTRGAHFDLVISDIKMPGLNGPTLYSHIRNEEPQLVERMIFTTGDTMSSGTQSFLQETNLPYLAKPFTIDDLRRRMVEVLGN